MKPFGSAGLTTVKTPHLVALVRALHRGDLHSPITHTGLATAGFLGIADGLEILGGLDKKAALAVIVAVLAERGPRLPLQGVIGS